MNYAAIARSIGEDGATIDARGYARPDRLVRDNTRAIGDSVVAIAPLLEILIVVGVSACSFGDDIPAPQLASVTPDHASAGATVTIAGSYFCQQAGASDDPLACLHPGSVSFGVINGSVVQYTDSMILAEVPEGVGMTQIVVSSAGRSSNSVDFTFEH